VTRWLLRTQLVRVAIGAVALAGLAVSATVRRALRSHDALAADSSAGVAAVLVAPVPVQGYGVDRVLTAVTKDPFHPDRRRPGTRFRLPGEAGAGTPHEARAVEVGVRLIGTAVTPDGPGFAMCAWEGGAPRIVRPGERVGDWTLTKVSPGAAEFATPAGTTVTVLVRKAGA
jgi:hypothetical protein